MYPTGDFGFAHDGAMQFPISAACTAAVAGRPRRFPFSRGMSQARPQFALVKSPARTRRRCQQARHGVTGWRAQVQCFGERDETDAEMLQFLKRRQQICYGAAPAVRRQTSTRSISRRRAASNTFSRASLRAAPEFTSRTCKAIAGTGPRETLSPASVPGQKRGRIRWSDLAFGEARFLGISARHRRSRSFSVSRRILHPTRNRSRCRRRPAPAARDSSMASTPPVLASPARRAAAAR